jgi:hypothetical protein
MPFGIDDAALAISAGSQAASTLGSLFGGDDADESQKYWARRNETLQRDAMTKSIQYRVADAQAAGIHPLYALGAQTMSPSPVGVGGSNQGPSKWDRLADMGQNISSSLKSMTTKEERAVAAVQTKQQLENGDLNNELLRSQIALNRANAVPSFPSNPTGGGFDDAVKTEIIPTFAKPKKGFMQQGSDKKPMYQSWETPMGPQVTFSDDVGTYMENDPISIPMFYSNAIMGALKKAIRDYALPSSTAMKKAYQYRKGGK